ncbi:MAG: histidinol-phosphate transaminase [Verrucomicrobia bacterium]|nr:histidinol-phosphate transaminase [Verrucomicrobiota bacterium]MDA1067761.1 histidinol-phosphate transaminase [Verrucomicrobiota bacterium]
MSTLNKNYTDLANPSVLKQPIYEPGKPIDLVAREFGLDPNSTIKLASNENPLGASPRALEAVKNFLDQSYLYPDGGCYELRKALSNKLQLDPGQFVFGNGSNEVIELIGHAFLQPGDEVVMGQQAFIVYKLITLLFQATPIEVPLVDFTHDLEGMRAAVSDKTKLIFLPCPNNPTGTLNPSDEVIAFARSLPDHVILVVDEAYAEFLESPLDLRPLIAEGRKIIGTRTFSKIYGLAGFRVGYGYCSAECAALLNRVREPFNVNAIAQVAAAAALSDDDFVEATRACNHNGLTQLVEFFKEHGIPFVPSVGNFILVKVGDGAGVFLSLQRLGVIVRPMGAYGFPEYVRISIGTVEHNRRLIESLQSVLGLS